MIKVARAYDSSCYTSTMEFFCKNSSFYFILDVWLGSEHASGKHLLSLFPHGLRYPRMDQVKFLEESLLLGPFLSTLTHKFFVS